MNDNKIYVVIIRYYEEETGTETDHIYCSESLDKSKERLEAEYNKTMDYAKEEGIDNACEDCFSPWLSDSRKDYEIQADGYFFEQGHIYEAEKA